MALTPDDVRWMAELARLELRADELDEVTRQLNGILAHVEQLEVEGAADDPPGRTPGAPLRDDESPADPLAAPPETFAPGWQGGFFTVPRLTAHDDGPAGEGPSGAPR